MVCELPDVRHGGAVLGAVRVLLDDASSGFVTGHCLTVDGELRA
jgi:hypothetical protein